MKYKITLTFALIFATAAVLLSGCKSASKPTPNQTAQVQSLCYAAASVGTQVALLQNPAYRPAFEIAYTSLDATVTSGTITGAGLRSILNTLPVNELKSPEARIAITSATTLFDALAGTQVSLTNNVYVVAAATGIRDGMKVALGH